MRHTVLVLGLLAVMTQLAACATSGVPGVMKGESGPVAWQIEDLRQTLDESGTVMRWNFMFVFKNTGSAPFNFESVEVGSRAGGPSDDVTGGMATVPFAHRLEPGGELHLNQSESWGCRQCAPAHLPRLFSEGVIIYYTFLGHDATGSAVRVPIAMRLDSSVGERE